MSCICHKFLVDAYDIYQHTCFSDICITYAKKLRNHEFVTYISGIEYIYIYIYCICNGSFSTTIYTTYEEKKIVQIMLISIKNRFNFYKFIKALNTIKCSNLPICNST